MMTSKALLLCMSMLLPLIYGAKQQQQQQQQQGSLVLPVCARPHVIAHRGGKLKRHGLGTNYVGGESCKQTP